MKLLKTLLVFTYCHVMAQNQSDCLNGISTNPSNPINPQANSSYMSAPQFINSNFDWHARNGQNSLVPWQTYNMIYDPNNPFTGGANNYISPFDPNGTPYATGYFPTNYDDMDFFPEDGWELLFMNMGYNPDGSYASVGISSVPYVILYNKYRSIVRVFGKTGDLNYITNPIRSVQIKFNFRNSNNNQHNGLSGLFSGQNTFITALDKKTAVTQIVSLVNHPNTVNQWFHADFHVNYDPCVCYFKSELELLDSFVSPNTIIVLQDCVIVLNRLAILKQESF
jgi:hypothetical protein